MFPTKEPQILGQEPKIARWHEFSAEQTFGSNQMCGLSVTYPIVLFGTSRTMRVLISYPMPIHKCRGILRAIPRGCNNQFVGQSKPIQIGDITMLVAHGIREPVQVYGIAQQQLDMPAIQHTPLRGLAYVDRIDSIFSARTSSQPTVGHIVEIRPRGIERREHMVKWFQWHT